jgi:hypothetical protein
LLLPSREALERWERNVRLQFGIHGEILGYKWGSKVNRTFMLTKSLDSFGKHPRLLGPNGHLQGSSKILSKGIYPTKDHKPTRHNVYVYTTTTQQPRQWTIPE